MIFYDLETTGVNILNDHIIEIYALKIEGETRTELHKFINPGIPIPLEASAIHGYTDEFVRDKPLLSDVIGEIDMFFAGQDIIGYNNRNFDNLIMAIEFIRCARDFKLDERKIIDVFEMWKKFEPRNLGGAYKRFCNENSEDLHGAREDVRVLNEVYLKMIENFELQEKSFEEISSMSSPDPNSFCFGKLIKNEAGYLTFNFGKYTGRTIHQVLATDPSYISWILDESNMDSAIKLYIIMERNRLRTA